MTNVFKCFLVLLTFLSLSACKDEERSGYVHLSGHMFIFNPRVATATYMVTLHIMKPLPKGSRAIVVFENPAGGEKLRQEKPIGDTQEKITFESEPLLCVKAAKPYAFEVNVFGPDNVVLQHIQSSITSTLDQSVLPPVPLVIGPGYEPNPAANSVEAGEIMRQRARDCPAS